MLTASLCYLQLLTIINTPIYICMYPCFSPPNLKALTTRPLANAINHLCKWYSSDFNSPTSSSTLRKHLP